MLKQIRKNILEMNLDMKLKAEIKCPENVLKYAEMFISFVLSDGITSDLKIYQISFNILFLGIYLKIQQIRTYNCSLQPCWISKWNQNHLACSGPPQIVNTKDEIDNGLLFVSDQFTYDKLQTELTDEYNISISNRQTTSIVTPTYFQLWLQYSGLPNL